MPRLAADPGDADDGAAVARGSAPMLGARDGRGKRSLRERLQALVCRNRVVGVELATANGN